MSKLNLEIIKDKNNNDYLKDISNNLKMLSYFAYDKKEYSLYQSIAKEIVSLMNNDYFMTLHLKKIKENYYRITTNDKSYLFVKGNIFSEVLIRADEFFDQKLVKLENYELPTMLKEEEKQNIIHTIEDSKALINKNYSRQELNSTDFNLTLDSNDLPKLFDIFDRMKYYGLTVREYIELIADNYDYKNNYEDNKMKLFKNTFNNYIIELGLYLSKAIEDNIN